MPRALYTRLRIIENRLDRIEDSILILNDKVEHLTAFVKLKRLTQKELALTTVLFSLPSHLRKTYQALIKLEPATATMIAKSTGRARAVESNYLNQLVRMYYACKKRQNRQVVFTLIINNVS